MAGCVGHVGWLLADALPISLAQDRESSPARTGGLTTMWHHQLGDPIPLSSAADELNYYCFFC